MSIQKALKRNSAVQTTNMTILVRVLVMSWFLGLFFLRSCHVLGARWPMSRTTWSCWPRRLQIRMWRALKREVRCGWQKSCDLNKELWVVSKKFGQIKVTYSKILLEYWRVFIWYVSLDPWPALKKTFCSPGLGLLAWRWTMVPSPGPFFSKDIYFRVGWTIGYLK